MPVATLQTSQGIPPDTQGANGDMCWDYQNRFFWGPKGNVTAGSWVGTANNANPVYAPQFGTTPGLLPASIFTGAQSSTPTATVMPGTTTTAIIAPTATTSLLAVLVTSNAAGTFDIYNQTTQTVLVGGLTFPANATNFPAGQPYPAGTYQLLAGNTYVIRVTGSATGTFTGFMPMVLVPATNIGQAVTSFGLQGFSSNTTFNTTAQVAYFYGSTTGAYFRPYRNGYIYNVVATYTPSGSSTSANYINAIMNQYSNSTNATTVYFNFGKVYGTGKPTVLGTFNPASLPTTSVNQYWFNVTADTSCTGTLSLDLQVVL